LSTVPEPDYQFSKRSMWVLRYDGGKPIALESTLKGPRFIQYLLQRPGHETSVLQMMLDLAAASPGDVGNVEEDMSVLSNDAGDLADGQTLHECKARYKELCAQRELAEKTSEESVANIQKEIDQLGSYLSTVLGIGGQQRKGADTVTKIRKRITRVIDTAIDKIHEADPALAAHLENCIITHASMSYKPDREIRWSF
jgi:hypothetical protein